MLFLDFYYHLRNWFRIPVTPGEFLTLMDAADQGLFSSVNEFYSVARAILIKDEKYYDAYDQAFLATFRDKEIPPEGGEEWRTQLEEIIHLDKLPKVRDLGTTLKLAPPKEKEIIPDRPEITGDQVRNPPQDVEGAGQGGSGTRGARGRSAGGVRTGGPSSGKTALVVASDRNFQNLRNDLVLETRHFQVALKKLRKLRRIGPMDHLNIDKTVDLTCSNGGWIDLVFDRRRRNDVKVLLLMDTGGSMKPFHQLVSRLFSAAQQLRHFKKFNFFYFHNSIYSTIFEDMDTRKEYSTAKLLRDYDPRTRLIFVGDASMHPWELDDSNPWTKEVNYHVTSLEWMRIIRHHFNKAVWLNPLRFTHYYHAETLDQIAAIFPMFELTLDGLDSAIKALI